MHQVTLLLRRANGLTVPTGSAYYIGSTINDVYFIRVSVAAVRTSVGRRFMWSATVSLALHD